MSQSLQQATGAETFSVMDLAESASMDVPVSVRELLSRRPAPGAITYDGEITYDRTKWANWISDHGDTKGEAAPSSKAELFATVQDNKDGKIRAVGSGHSHSRAPVPEERYIDLKNLTGTLNHNGWLKDTDDLDVEDKRHLVRLKGGTRIRDLNRQILAPKGLALKNMGSFDGQTIAGAVNTGTHGTGMGLSTVADMVKSVELVTVMPEGDERVVQMYRIEPSDGITDPAEFGRDKTTHGMGLIQDDETFYSVVVGYGCMGVVYAYTMEVRDYYWLKEDTQSRSWLDYSSITDDYTGKLETDEISTAETDPGTIPEDVPELLRNHRHVQLLINLPRVHDDGQPRAQTTVMERTHDITDPEEKPEDWEALVDNAAGQDNKWLDVSDDRWPPERRKTTFQDISRALGNAFHPLKDKSGWGGTLRTFFFKPAAAREPFVKKRTKTAWYIALRRLRDKNTDDSNYEQMPKPPSPPAISTDVAVPLHHLEDAIEDVFDIADDIYQDHEVMPFWRQAADAAVGLFGGNVEPRVETYKIHFASPMGIRFVAPSDHYLSAAHDEWSAMIEVPFPVEAANAQLLANVPNVSQSEMIEIAKDALTEIETHLVEEYDGRPHMGKYNTLTKQDLSELYDNFDRNGDWLETYRRFNSFGIFDNTWTDQFDISQAE
ncbi:FAD-binding protein [Halapricum hydrolyticum]|uniref:FAD-binding protein n=1 Tax=Halapricum hydrolyticum TaxID=2979991 RepID=A0AAE3LJG8_9EURY|nr:FAD-binding protein [Halapricum hydrolyticum]MCU4719118.1 FAD-binding protein [Halapricum hydrolyticum]MCU4727308.1 FAD-binding protein [Halapricum hydrolyticum]